MKVPFLPDSKFTASTAILAPAFRHGSGYACVVESNGDTAQPILYIPFPDHNGVATAMAEHIADLLTAASEGIVDKMQESIATMTAAGQAIDDRDASIKRMQIAIAIAMTKLDAIAHRRPDSRGNTADVIAFDALAAMRAALDSGTTAVLTAVDDCRRATDAEAKAA